jgi:hypothetical protein
MVPFQMSSQISFPLIAAGARAGVPPSEQKRGCPRLNQSPCCNTERTGRPHDS